VRSRRHERFDRALASLPAEVRAQARASYALFARDPFHPSLQFKRVRARRDLWSARVSDDYRALGVREDDVIVWIWIGTHAEYDQVLRRR
jgi:hypothetical protein